LIFENQVVEFPKLLNFRAQMEWEPTAYASYQGDLCQFKLKKTAVNRSVGVRYFRRYQWPEGESLNLTL
jgi:hypothetical protein